MAEALYLVQRDANVRGKDGRPKLIGVIGRCVPFAEGYKFFPNNASRKNGRTFHDSAVTCIPRWADDLAGARGFGDLLTGHELAQLQAHDAD